MAFVANVLDTPVTWLTTSDNNDTDNDPVLAHNLDAGLPARSTTASTS